MSGARVDLATTMSGGAGTGNVTDRGAWATGTVFNAHDLTEYGGATWLCQTPHTAGASFDDTKFTELGQFRGAWRATTLYEAGDVVVQAGALYQAPSRFTSAATFTAASWTALSGGSASSLSALTDVSESSPQDGQVLTYVAAAGKWENKNASSGTGGGLFVVTQAGNLGAAYAFNPSGNARSLVTGTLTANCTITISGLAAGEEIVFEVTQDATGSRTLTISDGAQTVPVAIDPTAGNLSTVVVRTPDGSVLDIDASGQGMSNPMTAANDLIIGAASGVPARLASVASKYLQTDGSGVVSWGNAPSGGGGGPAANPNKLSAWAFDHDVVSFSYTALTAGVLYLARLKDVQSVTAAKAGLFLSPGTNGAASLANAYFGLFVVSGANLVLVGATSDQSAAWAGVAAQFFTPALTVQAGQSLAIADSMQVYGGIVVGTQSTTAMQVPRSGQSNTSANLGLVAGTDPLRHASYGTGLTALPATVPIASLAIALPFWMSVI